MILYKSALAKYEREPENLHSVRVPIEETVATYLCIAYCPPEATVDVWYENLKREVGISEAGEKRKWESCTAAPAPDTSQSHY